MGIVSFPVRLTLAEGIAVSLLEAADDLAAARDVPGFVAALDVNGRLWSRLAEISERHRWQIPDPRVTDFVMTTTRYAGRGVQDDHVEALIGINRETARAMAGGRELDPIRARAALAWEENRRTRAQTFPSWLMAEIDRKGRIV